jgi:hypothetical protein
MSALGRADPADDPTILELLNIPFHRPFGDAYFFCEFWDGDQGILSHEFDYFPRHFPRRFRRATDQLHLTHRFAVNRGGEQAPIPSTYPPRVGALGWHI